MTLDGIVGGNDAATACCTCDCWDAPIPPELGLTEELETATFGVTDEVSGGLLAFMLDAATEAAADKIAAAAIAALVFAFVPA